MSYTREDVVNRLKLAVAGFGVDIDFNSYVRAAEEAQSWSDVLIAVDNGADPTVAVMRRELPIIPVKE